MKNEKELYADILKILTAIEDRFPELSKYITEMPVKISAGTDMTVKNLKNYYDSLNALLNNYMSTHTPLTNNQ
ncbi:MAG: hypothetical protein JWO09_1378 [Bacteroidetes bacterium]|nr:hypothetical protein [Bacteroidota bacterium]